jgi:hypothetical protein
VIVAGIIFALTPIIGLPTFFAVPLIGLALAAGVPPDYATEAKAVARRPRNHVLAMLILICLAVMVLQPQLALGWWCCSDSTPLVSSSQSSRSPR